MKNSIIVISSFLLLLFASCSNSSTNSSDTKITNDSTKAAEIYVCPMDPDVTSNKPGSCPKCGMDLEKKTE